MKNLLCLCVVAVFCLSPGSAQQSNSNPNSTVVPTMVNVSGTLTDVNHKPLSGIVGVTFYLYKDEQGGSPLWMETQNVQPDKYGHYTVMLGATKSQGLPTDMFVSGEARWLGVQAQGQTEQSRVLLLSVPYALKAGDAQTVGGLPASAFVLAAPATSSGSRPASASEAAQPLAPGTTPVTTAGGTVNKLAKFDATADITSSQIFDNGTNVGIGNTSPAAKLDVSGGATVRGLLFLPTQGTATATTAYNSQPIKLTSSVFNSGTGTAVAQNFQWQAQPTGNNTATPSGTLNLLFASGTSAPAAIGFYISNTGGLHSTYVGVRNNRSATATNTAILSPGIDLTGSIWDGTKNVDRTFRWQVDPGSATTAGKLNLMFGSGGTFSNTGLNISSSGAITFVPGQTFPGTGTITGITTATGSGLRGGGTSGTLNLGIDTNRVPLLAANNTFTAPQVIQVVMSGNQTALNVVAEPSATGEYSTTGLSAQGTSVGVYGNGRLGDGSVGVLGSAGDMDSVGVLGYAGGANPEAGVEGYSDAGAGVYGKSTNSSAFYGYSSSSSVAVMSLYGDNTTNSSGHLFDATSVGFGGSCFIDVKGNLGCSGSKSAVVPVAAGSRSVALYAVESPQNWFEDFGSGQLSNGSAIVPLETVFAQTVNSQLEYHVFLTPKGDCKGLYVFNETPSGFEVHELGAGTSNVGFDYRIVALRKDYENIRLADRTRDLELMKDRVPKRHAVPEPRQLGRPAITAPPVPAFALRSDTKK